MISLSNLSLAHECIHQIARKSHTNGWTSHPMYGIPVVLPIQSPPFPGAFPKRLRIQPQFNHEEDELSNVLYAGYFMFNGSIPMRSISPSLRKQTLKESPSKDESITIVFASLSLTHSQQWLTSWHGLERQNKMAYPKYNCTSTRSYASRPLPPPGIKSIARTHCNLRHRTDGGSTAQNYVLATHRSSHQFFAGQR